MHSQFWFDSWEQGGSKTSFHRRDIHPYVLEHLPPARLNAKRVLVPLCGKTLDMIHFRRHAEHVIGVELVEDAILQFFGEQQLPYTKRGNRYEAERLTVICGDFFSLTTADVGHIDLVYDRAALVALPLPMRRRYIQKIDELLPTGSQQFLNTIEYAPSRDEAPFSVGAEDVASYYGDRYAIEHLEHPTLPEHGMVRKFGLDYLKEHGFRLTKRRDPM